MKNGCFLKILDLHIAVQWHMILRVGFRLTIEFLYIPIASFHQCGIKHITKNIIGLQGFFPLSMSSSLISAIMICHHKIYWFVSHQFTWSSLLTQVIGNRKGGTYMVISSFHLPRTISTFIIHDRYLFQIFFETPVMEIPQPPWQNCALVTLREELFSFVCFNAEYITSFAEKEKILFPSYKNL